MFLGHTEGLTYIDSKGDGRYVISNGKDQTCKLWDLRKMISTDEGERIYTDVSCHVSVIILIAFANP
jgi:WD repeat-containing protein 23